MPKNKLESSSDTDSSGPEDRTPVTKKAKVEGSTSSSSSSKPISQSGGEAVWELEKNKRVTVRTFKGKTYIDIREFYDAGGEMKPGKKGISLTLGQWTMLQDLIPEVNKAVNDA